MMSGKFVSSRLILLIIRKIHVDVTSDELKQKLFLYEHYQHISPVSNHAGSYSANGMRYDCL